MIRFVILDDNPLHRNKTKRMVNMYMFKTSYEYDIIEFDSISSNFKNHVDMKYEHCIYILDYQLKGESGLDAARYIREKDWNSFIIVYSVMKDKILETLTKRLNILDFVDKGGDDTKEMNKLFKLCLRAMNIKADIKIVNGTRNYYFDANSILFVYRDTIERKCVIVMDTHEVAIAMDLNKLKVQMGSNFMYTHKSYLVNIKRVYTFNWKDFSVIFDNGRVENILSRTHKKELMSI